MNEKEIVREIDLTTPERYSIFGDQQIICKFAESKKFEDKDDE